jgi:hypothetical protein
VKRVCLYLVCLATVFGSGKIRAQFARHAARSGQVPPSRGRETLDPDKAAAFKWIDSNAEAIDKVSLELWNEPELSFREFKTSRTLMRYLEANGFTVQKNPGGLATAFVASYGAGTPVIGFFAEYDALAGLSQKGASPRTGRCRSAGSCVRAQLGSGRDGGRRCRGRYVDAAPRHQRHPPLLWNTRRGGGQR